MRTLACYMRSQITLVAHMDLHVSVSAGEELCLRPTHIVLDDFAGQKTLRP